METFVSITNRPPSSPTYGSPLIEENQNVPQRQRKYDIEKDSIRGSFFLSFNLDVFTEVKVNDFVSITNRPLSSPTYGSPLIEENQNVPQEEKKM